MRIVGITLPENKRIEYALTALFGIGISTARSILDNAKIDISKKTKDLTTEEENSIKTLLENLKIEGDLRRSVASNIKRLKDIKSYRGNRHSKHLPTRGQRTKTNTRTVRGNVRKTMGSGRRAVEKT
ncbi:MAG: 30S ribosomal protein S13 [Patescibacteria group bacterium]